MARAPEREHAEAGQILFSLESFEVMDGDRVEVSGRWFGVRGRRFVRPTLTVLGGHQRSRWLADLEHKPWSAEDGEPWTASFPVGLDGRDVRELELAVAPDIAITLAVPPSPREDGGDGEEATAAAQAARSDGMGVSEGLMSARPASARPSAPGGHRELDALRKRLDEQRKHVTELRRELEQAGVTKAEMSSALTRRDAAVRKFDALVRERDEAFAQRDESIAERGDAIRRRDQTIAALDEAIARRELAIHDAEEARRERDGALRERQSLVRASTRLQAERDDAVSRRNAALRQLERLQAEAQTEITQLRQQLEHERKAAAKADAASARALERQRSDTAPSPAPAPAPHEPSAAGPSNVAPQPVASRSDTTSPRRAKRPLDHAAYVWGRRLIAMVVLIAAIIAIVLIIHSP